VDRTLPSIAVIGIPALPALFAEAGFNVLTPSHDSPTVVAAIRAAAATTQRCITVVGGSDQGLRAWVKIQAANGLPILVAESDTLVFGDPVPKTRTITLPASFDDVLTALGAQPVGGALGETVIEADGTRRSAKPPDKVAPTDDEDPFAGIFDSGAPNVPAPGPAPARNPEPDDQVFAPAPTPLTEPELGNDVFAPTRAPEPDPDEQVFAPAPTPLTEPEPGDQVFAPTPAPSPTLNPSLVAPSEDIDPFEGASVPNPPVPVQRQQRPSSPVIIVFAGKGGVGKSVVSAALAERAASVGGISKVVLADANRGQGDVRQYLRVSGPLPSIFDAAVSGRIATAIVGPKRLNPSRPAGSQELHIGVVLAPTADQADPTVVTPEVYAAVIAEARKASNLVVIDTQISEGWDTSGIIDGVMIPLILNGAWGVVLSDSSRAGWKHMMERLSHLQAQGAPSNRIIAALNRVAPDAALDPSKVAALIRPYATWAGSAVADPVVATEFDTGRIPGTPGAAETPGFTTLLDAILYRVTGLDAFAPPDAAASNSTASDGTSPSHGKSFRRAKFSLFKKGA
jgi:Mrp family chromosome partitioning ATPase